MIFEPFFYQEEAVKAFFRFIGNKPNKGKNPLIVAPTGSGKSHILALICARIIEKWPHTNIVILSHTRDILVQDYEKLVAYLSDESLVGLYSAGLKQRDKRQITVAGIQSVYKMKSLFSDTNLVIVDEAHMIPPTGEGRYRTFLANNSPQFVLGLTATPYRLGTGMLTDEGHIFDRIIYDIDIRKLIDEGFLSKLKSKQPDARMDTKGIKVVAGDYSAKSLAEKFDRTNISDRICEELSYYKDKRKHWLVFAIDIDHAEHIADKLNEYGITAVSVHSRQDNSINTSLLRLYKAGQIQALVNVEKYTTGFDFPGIDLIAMLRPTKSPVLHVQTIGRGLRVNYNTSAVDNFDIHNRKHRMLAIEQSDKRDCLILDFAGNIERLGPIDKVEIIKRKGKGGGTAPTKTCPDCSEIVPLHIMACPDCGYEWPKIEKLELQATSASVLSEPKAPKTYNVKHVYYIKHNKIGARPTLKVTYACGIMDSFNEWIHFENPRLRSHAHHWWKFRAGTAAPSTVDEALERINELSTPAQVEVDFNERWPKIKRYHFRYDKRLENVRRSLSSPSGIPKGEEVSNGT